MKMGPPEFLFQDLRIDDLPPYNQDDDAHPSEPVKRLKAEIAAADGIIFVTPEYNRSIPGVLKNAIDHASRPYGESAWKGKPAGVLGASIGAQGTSMAQQHLRNILAYLDMPTLAQPEAFIQAGENFFGPDGHIASSDTRQFLQRWMDRYIAWVQRFRSK
jgi:chromate reductase